MATLPQKRSLSPDATIPEEDCTRDTFDQHANLSDRQFLSWALQTEARVRFAKLEGRNAGTDAATDGRDTTLNSDYLIDVYPDTGDIPVTEGKLARERHAFARKSIPYLENASDPDSSFETLTRLKIDRRQSKVLREETTGQNKPPIPPNLLYFQLILEAYMGYRVPSFRSDDPSHPSAAIMGGAVVATLTSWRDLSFSEPFTNFEKDLVKMLESDNVQRYNAAKKRLMQLMHGYFLANHGRNDSPFSLGDVDIFLQASPTTRSLTDKLQPIEIRDIICSFLGGSGFAFQDLHKFAKGLCEDHLLPIFEASRGRSWVNRNFCYALATNGLSFALGTGEKDEEFDSEEDWWPRTTQLIMLNEKADLVGGLMDFDISITSCAYNGTSVYVTPRAAFSLRTLTQVVTPFVFEEKRNRNRIVKYYERGFDAFIIDPYCQHERLCYAEMESLETPAQGRVQVARWLSADLRSPERYHEISEANADSERLSVCQNGPGHDRWIDHKYTVALFEKSEGHGIEYFAKRDSWSDEFRNQVMACPEAGRTACRYCRDEYGLQLVLEEAPPSIKSAKTVDDVLHGELTYMHTVGDCGDFRPSFYSGGAFSSFYVGHNARATYQLLGVMRSQQHLEKARYIRKHGSLVGYKNRFVYSENLARVFSEAQQCNLPANRRAPVGLNPERFIAKCKGCQEWLHGCEFTVQYCDECEGQKPSAAEN